VSPGRAPAPISSARKLLPSLYATKTRSTPTASAAAASQAALPVSWWSPTPIAAITTPITATVSSATTVLAVGSVVSRTNARHGTLRSRASPRVWRTARSSEMPSATNAKARVA